MDKKLIQQLLDDDETRLAIADTFGLINADIFNAACYDAMMIDALNKLNDTLTVGDMITIEVSDHMWVRGEYVRTETDGKVDVNVPGAGPLPYAGKRVVLVVKGEEGETK